MTLKSIIRYPIDIRRARQLLSSVRADDDAFAQRPIALDLVTPHLTIDCGRHLACLAHYTRAAGSQLWLRCSPLLLSQIARKIHGREMLAEPYVRWISPELRLPPDCFRLTDAEIASGACGASPASGLRMLIGRDCVVEAPTMPYPMHPATLPTADRALLAKLRQQTDRRGIFFAGNQKAKYGEQKISRDFGYLSRLAILQIVRQRFGARVRRSLDQQCEPDSIVLSDSRRDPIPAVRWLPTLAKARFFLCCPGASQPTCHNLIEAMSVGTIPLIEYGERVTPPLRDGVNAIRFSGERGLVEAIGRIDRMNDEEIHRMSQQVCRFFDEHLCGIQFLSQLRDGTRTSVSGLLNMPFHDRNLFDPSILSRLKRVA